MSKSAENHMLVARWVHNKIAFIGVNEATGGGIKVNRDTANLGGQIYFIWVWKDNIFETKLISTGVGKRVIEIIDCLRFLADDGYEWMTMEDYNAEKNSG